MKSNILDRCRMAGWRFVLDIKTEISLQVTISRGGKPFIQTIPYLPNEDIDYAFPSIDQALAFAQIVAQQGEKKMLKFLAENSPLPVTSDEFLRKLYETFPKKGKRS